MGYTLFNTCYSKEEEKTSSGSYRCWRGRCCGIWTKLRLLIIHMGRHLDGSWFSRERRIRSHSRIFLYGPINYRQRRWWSCINYHITRNRIRNVSCNCLYALKEKTSSLALDWHGGHLLFHELPKFGLLP